MNASAEEEKRPSNSRKPLLYAILASFLLGSFSGAAFGVLFAVSLNEKYYPWKETGLPQVIRERLVSAEDNQVVTAARKASPSVVSVIVNKSVASLYNRTGLLPNESFFDFGFPTSPSEDGEALQQVGGGTGFVLSADGLILTNRHVVADAEASYEVVLPDGRSFPAQVLARDAVLDIAVLKVEATDLPVPDIGDSDELQIGETVIAIGNALSEYQNTVTKGVVSGVNRRVVAGDGAGFSEVIEEAIQTDAAINPGNSGGPLVNLRGQVIGVNTAINRSGQSIGFAIPINAVKIVIDGVRTHGRIVRPWLGVRYVLVDDAVAQANGLAEPRGALVIGGGRPDRPAVIKDSPADAAGIVEKDLLLQIDGQTIDASHPLSSVIGRKRAGDVVTIELLRAGVRRTIQLTLGELPDELP